MHTVGPHFSACTLKNAQKRISRLLFMSVARHIRSHRLKDDYFRIISSDADIQRKTKEYTTYFSLSQDLLIRIHRRTHTPPSP